MSLKLFNTLSKKKEEIYPQNGKYIKLYTCGPTVYDYAHIGNFRTYIFEDLLKRTLRFLGYEVLHVMNITDIDDKTIKGAINNNIDLKRYVEPYIKAFFEDIKKLNINFADFYPKATDYIGEMIKIIAALLDKEIAYRGNDGSIYFSIKNFSSYGKLSHLKLENIEEGYSRIDLDEYEKENISDFVLWKAYDKKRDGDIFWESPFGKGRPGWHIECSAMALKILKDPIDIHCGGVDNIFPHHENEIAQSESFTGREFVKWWVHCEHLIVEGRKMSKSLGNFYILRDLLSKGFKAEEIRFELLSTHYRSNLNFTFEGLTAARKNLFKIEEMVRRLKTIDIDKYYGYADRFILNTLEGFEKALCDDLNISKALAVFFEFIKDINILCDKKNIGKKDVINILDFLKKIDEVLAFLPLEEEEIDIPKEIKEALSKREKARERKDWKEADKIRDFIFSKGFVIEDTEKGAVIKKRKF
ncbi:MAG: cysteinyl-tRNA synthetase [Chlamydiae bacterium SM23_39]|nr:MAG: cysteinyl-tRNA synthetase [Chlamydiae bacterium SM23_39]